MLRKRIKNILILLLKETKAITPKNKISRKHNPNNNNTNKVNPNFKIIPSIPPTLPPTDNNNPTNNNNK